MSRLAAVAIAVAALQACSVFQGERTHFLEEVSLYDSRRPGQIEGLSVDAQQRFVWTPVTPSRVVVEEENGLEVYGVRERTLVCAEPSPDAVSALSAQLSAQARADTAKIGAAASIDQAVSESIQQIGERTQVIQLMRDTLYRACEAYANGALDDFSYALILSQVDVFMTQMLAIDAIGGGGVDAGGQALTAARERRASADLELAQAEAAHRAAESDLASAEETDRQFARLIESTDDAAAKERFTTTRSNLDLAGKRAAVQTALERVVAARADLRVADSALDSARERAASARGGADQGAAGILRDIVDENTDIRNPSLGACLMWFARHPQVTLVGGAARMANGAPAPAIAQLCVGMLHRSGELAANREAHDQAIERFREGLPARH